MIINKFDWPVRETPKKVYAVWAALLLIILGIFTVFYFFFLAPSLTQIEGLRKDIGSHQKAIDSLAIDTGKIMQNKAYNDSIKLQYLGNKVAHLENQYGNVLNDIRQETNNHLEYINTWLGIWIAILALVCGVAPALLQYRLYIINRKKLKEELMLYEQIIGCHEITNYVNSVIQCMDSQIIADSTSSRKLIGILLNKCTDSLDRLLCIIQEDQKEFFAPSHRNALTLSLVQLSGMLDKIKIRVKYNGQRQLNGLSQRIRMTINMLTEPDSKESTDTIYKSLFHILQELRNLRLNWDYIED